MKILLCTSETGTTAGGLALHCSQLKEIFETLGHIVYEEVLLKPKDYYVIDGGYDPDLGEKIRASYKLKDLSDSYGNKVDLCVSCGGGRTAYYSMLFCKMNEIPLNIVLCGSEINLACEKTSLAFYNSEALKYASAVIGLSNELNQNARCLGENKNCRYYVVPNICEISNSDSCQSEKTEKESIIYSSGAAFLGEKKGIANLILAFSVLINEMGRNDILYLYGKIDSDIEAKYIDLIYKYSLAENVILCGYLDREAFHEKMRETDVYIQASPFEGYGNSVAEAIKNGKEILISNTGYIAENLVDSFPEHVMKSLKSTDMAKDIYRFSTETLHKREGSKIRQWLSRKLSKSVILEQWDQILKGTKNSKMCMDNTTCTAVMFHDVSVSYTGIDYAKDGFVSLLDKIHKSGRRLCSAREYFSTENKTDLIICTFDDGYESVYLNALPIMKKYGFAATVYICPDLIGKNNAWNHKDEVNRQHLNADMIKSLLQAGWEIGSHGMNHMNLKRLSEHELEHCLLDSKNLLGEYGPIESFCYPYGDFNLYIKGKVQKFYDNAFSVNVGGSSYAADRYQITRLTPEELIKRLEL